LIHSLARPSPIKVDSKDNAWLTDPVHV
jgi:hypothetical protein